jgi:predicted nucleic acid-binding protein
MPASGRFLLDTNIVIALLSGDEVVLSHLDTTSRVFIPAVVVGELFFGAAKSAAKRRTQPMWSDSRLSSPFFLVISLLRENTGG